MVPIGRSIECMLDIFHELQHFPLLTKEKEYRVKVVVKKV